ncbi:LysR substrate-binding domain-containing protein [Comamonas koreensis]|uniref:LysR substrate-binding domain-containing protein n=1 Tax=Comamonas koreensis TaxID=160825 RepID=A0AAW4Y284_9BURK|nr:LysR substrate-binding domain-containing protein [Comamonas koreensis]MCD2167490.1 LysR substrate-binding domain-containing protein [Comamonas koreensis]
MKYKLPPLQPLRVFESVYRHGSIRKAADELCLTPQAASQQLKQLESALEVQLFERGTRGLLASAEAQTLYHYVEQGLDALSQGLEAVRAHHNDAQFHIQVSPYFATQYLIRSLPSFTKDYPALDLRISIGVELPSFDTSDLDAAIVWGYGGVDHLDETPLLEDLKVIVATPQLLAEHPVETAQDLAHHRLISPLTHNSLWRDIYAMLGLQPGDKHVSPMLLHTHDAMLQAVLSGQGVGLLSYVDALSYIHSGKLLAPFGPELLRQLPMDRTPKFHLYTRRGAGERPIQASFRQWLLDKLASSDFIGYTSRLPQGGSTIEASAVSPS